MTTYLNRELRHTQAINIQLGVELFFAGKRRFVTAEQQQVLDLLLGTYEAAVEKNKALIKTQEELRELNESLEKRVEERTAELRAEITERQRIEEERTHLLIREQKARAEAEAAGRAKDEFLATVSHELRTPLTSIFGWTRLIRSGKLDEPNVARALETIERNANLQTQIVDDLLDVSRIITGNLRLAVCAVNLSTIIETTINALRPAVEAKSIQLETTLEASADQVAGDEQRLQQVVWNLLSNAIKFTREGGRIDVRLGLFDNHVQLSVCDTGIGINPEFLPYVFERFRQADGSTTRAYGGLGLGLAIVRHLVELHGGTVHAESRGEGQGSIFTVQLRQWIKREENSTTSDKRPPQSPREKRGGLRLSCPPELNDLRILLVDDNQDALELWSAVLKQCGAEILAVTSVRAALKAFDDWKPDVLISDIGMSGESGYDLIRMVRAREAERGGRVPALALTGYAREEDRIEALRAGFHKHIVKPVSPDELVATVAGLSERDVSIRNTF